MEHKDYKDLADHEGQKVTKEIKVNKVMQVLLVPPVLKETKDLGG